MTWFPGTSWLAFWNSAVISYSSSPPPTNMTRNTAAATIARIATILPADRLKMVSLESLTWEFGVARPSPRTLSKLPGSERGVKGQPTARKPHFYATICPLFFELRLRASRARSQARTRVRRNERLSGVTVIYYARSRSGPPEGIRKGDILNAGSLNVVRRGRLGILVASASARSRCQPSPPATSSVPRTGPTPRSTTRAASPPAARCPRPARSAQPSPAAGPGKVRVVCQGSSLDLAKSLSIKKANKDGFRLRPSQPKEEALDNKADKLTKINKDLARCASTNSVQDAINDSGNNDRVVIMPGATRSPTRGRPPSTTRSAIPSLLQENQYGRADAVVRVPGNVPERPEPDLRPGPRGRGRAAGRA